MDMERQRALTPWNSEYARLGKNQGYFIYKDKDGVGHCLRITSVARAVHESIFASPFQHYYGNEVSLNGYLDDHAKVEGAIYGAGYNIGHWNGMTEAQVSYSEFEYHIRELEGYERRLQERINEKKAELDRLQNACCKLRTDCIGCSEYSVSDHYDQGVKHGLDIFCALKCRKAHVKNEPLPVPPSIFDKPECKEDER